MFTFTFPFTDEQTQTGARSILPEMASVKKRPTLMVVHYLRHSPPSSAGPAGGAQNHVWLAGRQPRVALLQRREGVRHAWYLCKPVQNLNSDRTLVRNSDSVIGQRAFCDTSKKCFLSVQLCKFRGSFVDGEYIVKNHEQLTKLAPSWMAHWLRRAGALGLHV